MAACSMVEEEWESVVETTYMVDLTEFSWSKPFDLEVSQILNMAGDNWVSHSLRVYISKIYVQEIWKYIWKCLCSIVASM